MEHLGLHRVSDPRVRAIDVPMAPPRAGINWRPTETARPDTEIVPVLLDFGVDT